MMLHPETFSDFHLVSTYFTLNLEDAFFLLSNHIPILYKSSVLDEVLWPSGRATEPFHPPVSHPGS